MNMIDIDAHAVELEEFCFDDRYNTITFYFTADKKWVEDTHPEAEFATIAIEVNVKNHQALEPVTISPTKKSEWSEGYEDYDVVVCDLTDTSIEKLISKGFAEMHRFDKEK